MNKFKPEVAATFPAKGVQTVAPAPRNIATRPNVSLGRGLESETIRVKGLKGTSFDLCSIGVVPEGEEARQVFQGPLVPGPWAYTVTHALVIDSCGTAARERAAARVFEVGEPFTIEGCPGVYTFRSPNLRKLEGDGAKLERLDG